MKTYYIKSFIVVSISLFVMGCGTLVTRHYYSPHMSSNWKSLGGRIFQFKCNSGEVEVSPLILYSTDVKEQEKPWMYLNFRSTERIKNCDLSFVSLEDKVSGKLIRPIHAKTNVLNDDHLKKKTTYCYYYFDIKEERNVRYNLYISDELFGCKVDPISLVYDESTEWVPVQLQ